MSGETGQESGEVHELRKLMQACRSQPRPATSRCHCRGANFRIDADASEMKSEMEKTEFKDVVDLSVEDLKLLSQEEQPEGYAIHTYQEAIQLPDGRWSVQQNDHTSVCNHASEYGRWFDDEHSAWVAAACGRRDIPLPTDWSSIHEHEDPSLIGYDCEEPIYLSMGPVKLTIKTSTGRTCEIPMHYMKRFMEAAYADICEQNSLLSNPNTYLQETALGMLEFFSDD